MYTIAKKYNVDLQKLIELNDHIADPNRIDVGMKIKIPSGSGQTPAPVGEIVHKHVVVQGDTLWKLSKAWNVPLKALIDANPHLKNPNILLTGDIVFIPKIGSAASNESLAAGVNEMVSAPPNVVSPAPAEQVAPVLPAAEEEPTKMEPEKPKPETAPIMEVTEPKPSVTPEAAPNVYASPMANVTPETAPNVFAAPMANMMPETAPNMNVAPMANVMPETAPNMFAAPMANVMPETAPNMYASPMANVMPEMAPNMYASPMANVMPETAPNMYASPMANVMPETAPNMYASPMANMMPEMGPTGDITNLFAQYNVPATEVMASGHANLYHQPAYMGGQSYASMQENDLAPLMKVPQLSDQATSLKAESFVSPETETKKKETEPKSKSQHAEAAASPKAYGTEMFATPLAEFPGLQSGMMPLCYPCHAHNVGMQAAPYAANVSPHAYGPNVPPMPSLFPQAYTPNVSPMSAFPDAYGPNVPPMPSLFPQAYAPNMSPMSVFPDAYGPNIPQMQPVSPEYYATTAGSKKGGCPCQAKRQENPVVASHADQADHASQTEAENEEESNLRNRPDDPKATVSSAKRSAKQKRKPAKRVRKEARPWTRV